MHLFDDHLLAAIKQLCARYHVRKLELFGSAARSESDPTSSDFDFLVMFEDLGWEGSFKRYMGLKFDLEDLLGRKVDLVEPDSVTNPYFLSHIAVDRRPIYAA